MFIKIWIFSLIILIIFSGIIEIIVDDEPSTKFYNFLRFIFSAMVHYIIFNFILLIVAILYSAIFQI